MAQKGQSFFELHCRFFENQQPENIKKEKEKETLLIGKLHKSTSLTGHQRIQKENLQIPKLQENLQSEFALA